MAIKLNNLFQRFDDSFSGSYSRDWSHTQKWFDILYNIMCLKDTTEKKKKIHTN